MSSEAAEQLPPSSQKRSKLSYTREFLLSFSGLNICKELPSGIDASVLSELREASSGSVFEWQRSSGASSKRGDYGLLPPSRPEGSSGYFRGSTGRWDAVSSGSSDRDGDLQSDIDSGRRLGNNTRRSLQQTEHDGLLGSGAFPRPTSGYAGASTPKTRGTSQHLTSGSVEPYQPPRPYKAVPYSRKDHTDSFNDETFGSAEYSSEDRAEEERKRRASFEFMRKEQQKALQEKQKPITGNQRENLDTDIVGLLGSSKDAKSIKTRIIKLDNSVTPSLPQNDPSRTSRPPVPPGFATAPVEKNICMQSSSTALRPEVSSNFSQKNLTLNGMDNDQESRKFSAAPMEASMQNTDSKSSSVQFVDVNKNITVPSLGAKGPMHSVGFENVTLETFGLPDANEVWKEVVNDLSGKKEARKEDLYTDNYNHSTSILEKLFGNALSKDCSTSSSFVEYQGVKKEEEDRSPVLSESSKFAQWFLEDGKPTTSQSCELPVSFSNQFSLLYAEKKPVEDSSSRDLLSLIISNEKPGSQSFISNDKVIEHNLPSLTSENKDPVAEVSATPPLVGIPEKYSAAEKLNSSSGVLTCADLEQSILAEVEVSSSNLQHSVQALDTKSQEQKVDVDDSASQHLLSLLQMGRKKPILSPMKGASDEFVISDVKPSLSVGVTDSSTVRSSESAHSSENKLTLEALFGVAFMNELHSVEAPLSVKRGLAGETITTDVTEPPGLPLPHADDSFLSSTSNEYLTSQSIHERNMSASHQIEEARAHTSAGPWVRYGDATVDGSKLGSVGFEVCAGEVQLPEEDSLITLGDSLSRINSDSPHFEIANKEQHIPEKTMELVNGKLLNAMFRDGARLNSHRLGGHPLRDGVHLNTHDLGGHPPIHGHYDMINSENLYNHSNGRQSPHFPQQLNQTQTRPFFPQLDHPACRNPQMKFMGPDSIHHDPRNPFPTNDISQHTFNPTGGPRFDPAAHHLMLQHMPLPPNFPPHHPIQSLPRGGPVSRQINHMPGYMHEMNNVHSFPQLNRQPYIGGLEMGMPGIGVGGGPHPESIERLIEMEMRAKSKQIHPTASGQIPGIYGHELDMNFRYR